MDRSTRAIHPEACCPDGANPPVIAPVYGSVKFSFKKFADLEQYIAGQKQGFSYGRVCNPTVRQLEMQIGGFFDNRDVVAFASGAAAVTHTLLSLLKSGDHVVLFYECYAPTRIFVRDFLTKFGIQFDILNYAPNQNCLDKLNELIRPETKLVMMESPTNPLTRVLDLKGIAKICRSRGVLSMVDATFAGIHQYTDLDLDLIVHSLTKFVSGAGDCLAGCVIGQPKILQSIRMASIELGASLDPQVAYRLGLSLKTYLLRYEQQSRNAYEVAKFLATHPAVHHVLYPLLENHPDYEIARDQLEHGGGVISFRIKDQSRFSGFFDRLKLFHVCASLGSVDSLAAPAKMFYAKDLTAEECQRAGICDSTVRLSIGLESPADLIRDLKDALE